MTDKMKRRLCTAVFTLSLISMAVFTVMYVKTQKEYRHSERDIAAVMEIRGAISPALTINEKSRLDEASLRAAEYESAQERREGCRLLKEINQDVAAWITIAGTPIDYPVMQTPDSPDYYYRRGFDGRYSAYGMIYMDADYYKEHPEICLDTPDSSSVYEIVGVVRLPAEKLSSGFAAVLAARTREEYESFVQYIKKHAAYDTGITAEWPRQLITLTTCEYTLKDGRLLVVARKKR